jgi:hypothetical protein
MWQPRPMHGVMVSSRSAPLPSVELFVPRVHDTNPCANAQDSAFAKRTQKLVVPADDFAQGITWKNDHGNDCPFSSALLL